MPFSSTIKVTGLWNLRLPRSVTALISGNFDSPSYSVGKNMDFGCLHTGQRQSAGRFSNGVPAGMPFFGSPMAGSYTQPHFAHFIFFMIVLPK